MTAMITVASVAAAKATTLDFVFTDSSGATAALTLTASGGDNGYGARDITDVQGHVSDGAGSGDVTSFIPTPGLAGEVVSPDGRWLYDNWLYASPAQVTGNIHQHGVLDNGGVLFNVGDYEYNLFWNSNGSGGYELESFNNGNYTGNAYGNVAVPEPAAWSLMLLGFGALGLALRRHRRVAFVAT